MNRTIERQILASLIAQANADMVAFPQAADALDAKFGGAR